MEQEHKPHAEPSGTLSPVDLESYEDHLLHCPHCKTLIKADDINIDKLVAKCAKCDHVFSFGHAPRALIGYSRPDMLIPSGLEVLKLQNELDIQVDWYRAIPRSSFTFTLVFTLMWNLILLPFVVASIATGTYSILAFTSAHLAVGLIFLYRMFSVFLNTTHVNVSRRYLELKTTPLPTPFRRDRKIPTDSIEQLYVTKYVESRTNGNPNYAYSLYAILKDGEKIRLAKGMNLETQKYLEYEIESFLGIKNEEVKDEV